MTRADQDSKPLPPGQRLVEKWPVLDLGDRPVVPLQDWNLRIDGAVSTPIDLDWRGFQALPECSVTADVHCVTSWSLLGSVWTGVSTATLAEQVSPSPKARFVLIKSHDGYTTNMPVERFLAPDSLLASARNGEAIPAEHGGPVRVVLPSLYFWKSAKWVRRLFFSETDEPGYWERRGYSNDADPWKEQRYG